jgi:hypothetical protein
MNKLSSVRSTVNDESSQDYVYFIYKYMKGKKIARLNIYCRAYFFLYIVCVYMFITCNETAKSWIINCRVCY